MSPDPTDLTLSEADRRELIVWTVSCAERLLPIFEVQRPDDFACAKRSQERSRSRVTR
jgi:hypothetical protein